MTTNMTDIAFASTDPTDLHPDIAELKPFLNPTGVAVIGATASPEKLGFGLTRNLINSEYGGGIHLVNPKGGEILGRPVYPDIESVPDPVDLAVVLVPARFVAETIADCGRRGIKSIIIASGGFKEVGEEGLVLEHEILRVAREWGCRLIGPNCVGLIHTHVPLDTTFLSPREMKPGSVAFVSQSGAICAAVVDWSTGQGFGLSALISLGNQVDVTESEALELVAADPHTRVITVYLEGVADGRAFVREISRVSRLKPIIALKVGRSEAGGRAVASHTGALAGQDAVYEAAFRRNGILRAQTTEELFAWARALANSPLPRGRRVAILTNAGGPAVAAMDAISAEELLPAVFSEKTRTALQARLHPAANTQNPVDMLAAAGPRDYAECLSIIMQDDGVDGVLVIMPPPPMYAAEDVASAIIPIIRQGAKPVLVVPMGEERIRDAVRRFRAAGVSEYRFPERAVTAMSVLAKRAEFLSNGHLRILDCSLDSKSIGTILDDNKSNEGFLDLTTASALIAAAGIPIARTRPADSSEDAVRIALEEGLPVAMKISSRHVVHKSDVGGLALNLASEIDVSRAFADLSDVTAGIPQNQSQICVQKMVPGGLELVVGAVRDPQFGPVVMFGTGGTNVESMKDVVFGLAPLSEEDLDDMFFSTYGGKQLIGPRSLYRGGLDGVRDTLCRLGQLMDQYPSVAEIEINPLIVPPESNEAIAVDARVKLRTTE
jgi:acetyltransferase